MGPAANASKGRVNPQGAGLWQPTGHESESPSGQHEEGRIRSAVGLGDEFAQLHAGAAGQVEHCAIDEANSDPPVGCGLDDVTLANRIANCDFNGDAARTPDSAAASYRRLNVANHLRRQGRSRLTPAPEIYAGRN